MTIIQQNLAPQYAYNHLPVIWWSMIYSQNQSGLSDGFWRRGLNLAFRCLPLICSLAEPCCPYTLHIISAIAVCKLPIQVYHWHFLGVTPYNIWWIPYTVPALLFSLNQLIFFSVKMYFSFRCVYTVVCEMLALSTVGNTCIWDFPSL